MMSGYGGENLTRQLGKKLCLVRPLYLLFSIFCLSLQTKEDCWAEHEACILALRTAHGILAGIDEG